LAGFVECDAGGGGYAGCAAAGGGPGSALGGGGLTPGFAEGTAEDAGAGYGYLNYGAMCLDGC